SASGARRGIRCRAVRVLFMINRILRSAFWAILAAALIYRANATDLFYADYGRVPPVRMPSRKIHVPRAIGSDARIGTDVGLARRDGAEVTVQDLPSPLRHVSVLMMLMDRNSNLWTGASRGLVLYWQTWWFRLSVASVCALAILALHRIRL